MSAEDGNQYSLRRSAAAALDMLSIVFGGELLPHILPYLQNQLNPQQQAWRHRECAILALGAIAEGCYEEMKPHLANLIPFLIPFLTDPHPLIRIITAWTLSRYFSWVVRQTNHSLYFQPILAGLLTSAMDDNRRVQEAACSAVATLEEFARADLVPYLDSVVQFLVSAFDKYSLKNMSILYDALGTLAESVHVELNKPAYVTAIMNKLTVRWNALADDDRRLLPLLECLQSLAAALGPGFYPYAPHIMQRCLRIVEQTLLRLQMSAQGQADPPDQEFMVCAFDLISGIADGSRAQFASLLLPQEQMGTQHSFAVLLLAGGRESRPDVRQSCYALVGDVARYAFPLLKPVLGDLIPLLIQNIRPDQIGMCNNTVWALGEICLKLGVDVAVFAPVLADKLIPIITKTGANRNLLENTAITIGRASVFAPQAFAPHLPRFAQPWCVILKKIRDDVEKDSAFRGLCKLIETNPNGVVQHFVFVCDAIASWNNLQPDLAAIFSNILHSFRNSMNPQTWTEYFNSFPASIREILDQRYKLSYKQ
jgi:transportin-1